LLTTPHSEPAWGRNADAVCDRLVHNAHRVKLGGESIRKTKADLTKGQKPAM